MISPHDRLRILQILIAETLDEARIDAARQVLETATAEQIQRILLILGEIGTGGALFAVACFVDWS